MIIRTKSTEPGNSSSRSVCDKAKARLDVLNEQRTDLSQSLRELLDDVFSGRKCLKVYRQMKMYNDPTLNPYLYQAQKKAAA